MSDNQVDPVATARNFIRPAVLEHVRHWWASDGLFHRSIRGGNGAINPQTIRDISRSYGVSRGLLSGKEEDVALFLDDKLTCWPDNIFKRASFVRSIAVEAEERGFTKGVLLSAFSKIIWFAQPEGWTLYDSFARRGLQSAHRSDGADEYEKYYNRLAYLNFDNAMEVGREIISEHGFPYLWPERILDKYLMYVGHVPAKGLRVVNVGLHDDLLNIWRDFYGDQVEKVDALADDFSNKLCDHQIFQAHTLL